MSFWRERALTPLDAALDTLVYHTWAVPPALRPSLVRLLQTAPGRRLDMLRAALQREPDPLPGFLATTGTPAFLCYLLDDLAEAGALSRREASQVQDAILAGVDAHGNWLSLPNSRAPAGAGSRERVQ